jgi:hypothetical protein
MKKENAVLLKKLAEGVSSATPEFTRREIKVRRAA